MQCVFIAQDERLRPAPGCVCSTPVMVLEDTGLSEKKWGNIWESSTPMQNLESADRGGDSGEYVAVPAKEVGVPAGKESPNMANLKERFVTGMRTDKRSTSSIYNGEAYAGLIRTGARKEQYVTCWPNFRPFDCSALDDHVYI